MSTYMYVLRFAWVARSGTYRARRTGRSQATLQRAWRSQIAGPRCVLMHGIALPEQENISCT
eukprot:7380628-Prymnesium_polylepis.1